MAEKVKLTETERATLEALAKAGSGMSLPQLAGIDERLGRVARMMQRRRPQLVSVRIGRAGFYYASITPAGRSALEEQK